MANAGSMNPSNVQPMTFRNNTPAFIWAFTAVFLLFLSAMTFLVLRDGAPSGYSLSFTVAVLLLFWTGGLGLLAYASAKPCSRVTLQPDGEVLFALRYPFRSVGRRVKAHDLTPARVVESQDDEGLPYFYARVVLKDGSAMDLSEGHSRERCEETCRRFNGRISAPAPPGGAPTEGREP